jgi:soluble lytic murein transglycosylase
VTRGRLLLVVGLVAAAGAALVITRVDVEKAINEVRLPLRHEDIIRQQAVRFGLDPALIAAIINEESGFSDQTSEAGARGLMQITPATADTIERLSGGETFVYEDLANPDLNIRYGTFYLNHLLERFEGNEVAALAAYNAGPENVENWGGADLELDGIQFTDTHAYVDNVLAGREDYRDTHAEDLGL